MYKKILVELEIWTDNKDVIDNTINYLECRADECYKCSARIIDYKDIERNEPKKGMVIKSDSDIKVGNLLMREGTEIYKCVCGNILSWKYKYCNKCGQKLKWDYSKKV